MNTSAYQRRKQRYFAQVCSSWWWRSLSGWSANKIFLITACPRRPGSYPCNNFANNHTFARSSLCCKVRGFSQFLLSLFYEFLTWARSTLKWDQTRWVDFCVSSMHTEKRYAPVRGSLVSTLSSKLGRYWSRIRFFGEVQMLLNFQIFSAGAESDNGTIMVTDNHSAFWKLHL